MPFISKLKIHSIRSTNKYKVIAALDYQCDTHLIRVPAGFITDFATIPFCVRPDHHFIREAAVVHDFLYSFHSQHHYPYINKHEADTILLKAMEDLGAGWLTKLLVYWGVTMFGKSYYKVSL